MNPTSNPASNTGSPNGYPTRTVQSLNMQSPSTQAQGANQSDAQNAGVQNTGTHSLPALLIPEDYRARAVALHARELILRSPHMSAIALNGFSGGFGAGFSAGFEEAGERAPAEGATTSGGADPRAVRTLRAVDCSRNPSPSARFSKTPWTRQSAPSTASTWGTRAQTEAT